MVLWLTPWAANPGVAGSIPRSTHIFYVPFSFIILFQAKITFLTLFEDSLPKEKNWNPKYGVSKSRSAVHHSNGVEPTRLVQVRSISIEK